MPNKGLFYDVDQQPSGIILEFHYLKRGKEIAFDFEQESYRYSIRIARVEGVLFEGTAISQPGGEEARVACRVFKDPDDHLLFIVGHEWRYPNHDENWRWMVEALLE